MSKTILLTGATDGIGLETARKLVFWGHTVLLHGRNTSKLQELVNMLSPLQQEGGRIEIYKADLSIMSEVVAFARNVAEKHTKLDVLINNAGVYSARDIITKDGLDARFAVNTIAPYLLTKLLLPLLGSPGRVINLSSAAQSTVDLKSFAGLGRLSDGAAYSQSKLALTMWSNSMALSLKNEGPSIIAVNPGSMLGSKMVKQAFGVAGRDLGIGADILCRAALADDFKDASGKYFDNDSGRFTSPHPDALDQKKSEIIISTIEAILADIFK